MESNVPPLASSSPVFTVCETCYEPIRQVIGRGYDRGPELYILKEPIWGGANGDKPFCSDGCRQSYYNSFGEEE